MRPRISSSDIHRHHRLGLQALLRLARLARLAQCYGKKTKKNQLVRMYRGASDFGFVGIFNEDSMGRR